MRVRLPYGIELKEVALWLAQHSADARIYSVMPLKTWTLSDGSTAYATDARDAFWELATDDQAVATIALLTFGVDS